KVNIPCQLYSLGELNLGVLCACLPSLKPLFAKFFGLKLKRIDTPMVKDSVPWRNGGNDPFPISTGNDTKYTDDTMLGTVADVKVGEESKEDLAKGGSEEDRVTLDEKRGDVLV